MGMIQKIWKIKNRPEEAIAGSGNLHPVVLRILVNRGVVSEEEVKKFFSSSYEADVFDPFLFSDMEKAMIRVKEANRAIHGLAEKLASTTMNSPTKPLVAGRPELAMANST